METAATEFEKNITCRGIIKRSLIKDMTNFLEMPNKLSSKKRRKINKRRLKARIEETSSRKATISSLDFFQKKELLVLIPATKKLESKFEDIDIAMIGADAYCIACCIKRDQVFAVLIEDIQYQAEKKARAETDPNSVVA